MHTHTHTHTPIHSFTHNPHTHLLTHKLPHMHTLILSNMRTPIEAPKSRHNLSILRTHTFISYYLARPNQQRKLSFTLAYKHTHTHTHTKRTQPPGGRLTI